MASPDDPDRAKTSRARRLQEIKAAIENGTYDTDEKLEQALSRMFDCVIEEDEKPGKSDHRPT